MTLNESIGKVAANSNKKKISLWRIYLFSYSLAVRSISWRHLKGALRLFLEPCTYWRNVEIPAVLNHLQVSVGEKVLDIGSPKLPSLLLWKRFQAEVWATDLLPYFVDEFSHYKDRLETTELSATYHIELQDARKLAYPDSSFDKVYAISVIEHIEDPGDSVAIKEIARVLKPGGLCCLTVPAARNYLESTIAEELYYKKPIDGKPVFFQRHYDEDALRMRLIDPSGLELRAMEHFGERWIPYEELYWKLPRFIKIPISFLGPVFSKLFLFRIKSGSSVEPKTALLVLRKAPSAGP